MKRQNNYVPSVLCRNIISYPVRRLGCNGSELARFLNVTRSAINTGADRGKQLVEESEALRTAISNLTK